MRDCCCRYALLRGALSSAVALITVASSAGAHAQATQTKITATDAAIQDRFGNSVSVSGDTAIVGAGNEGGDSSGSAYVFVRDAQGNWTQQQKLVATDAAAGDRFGWSVAVSGDTAVVGAIVGDDDSRINDSGAAYVFVRDAQGSWTQQAKLNAGDSNVGDRFGWSVAMSGDTAVVGAPLDDDAGLNSGSAYVFIRDAQGNWTEQVKLKANDGASSDEFGRSVALNGDTAIVGAPFDDDAGLNSGSAYGFVRNAQGSWFAGVTLLQLPKLTASDAAAEDRFGWSVSMSGNTAIVGAPLDDADGVKSGSAYVFVRANAGSAFSQTQKLRANDGAPFDFFGTSIAQSDDIAIVGAYGDDPPGDSGAAYVYVRDSAGVWSHEEKLKADDAGSGDRFGDSVSLSGHTAIVGAFLDDDASVIESGSAYLFELPGADADDDGEPDATDNCPDDPNTNQSDLDGDGEGDVCDADPCPAGRELDAAQTACQPCSAGTFSPSGAACAPCGLGTVSTVDGAIACESCSSGSVPTAGLNACQACPAGSTPNASGSSCVTCGAGEVAASGAGTCTTCLSGTIPNAAGSACEACGPGTFTALAGQTACAECGPGTYASGNGNTGCLDCSAGTFSAGSGAASCELCEAGTFSDVNGSIACTDCASNAVSNAGASSCTACSAGQIPDPTGAVCIATSNDDDGDGVPDDQDLCIGDDARGDTDGDGICDDRDVDIDGDNVINDEDSNPTRPGPVKLEFGVQELYGTFHHAGTTYTVTIPLDMITYRNGNSHKAWLKPEEYRLSVTPAFPGGTRRVTCDGLGQPRTRGFVSRNRPRIDCQWVAGPSSSSPRGTFTVTTRSRRGLPPPIARFRSFRLASKVLRGSIEYGGQSYPVSVALDEVDYRSGNSHSAFINPEGAAYRFDLSSLNGLSPRIKLTGCTPIRHKGPGTDGIFNNTGRPRVTCTWKRGNGSQPPANFGTVVLE